MDALRALLVELEAALAEKRTVDALAMAERALFHFPDSADLHRLHGRALIAIGKTSEAEAAFRRCVDLSPDDPRAMANLGLLLQRRGEHGEAAVWFDRALQLRPDDERALRGLSLSLAKAGFVEEALARLAAGTAKEVATLLARASILIDAGRLAQAHELLSQACAERADAGLWRALGSVCDRLDRPGDAAQAYRRALEQDPSLTDLEGPLGDALRRERRELFAAEELLAAATTASPAQGELWISRATLAFELGQLANATSWLRRGIALAEADGRERFELRSTLLYMMSHDEAISPEELTRAHRQWGEDVERRVRRASASPPSRRAQRTPARVGYLSCDFREHVVMRLMGPIFAAHDAALVEVVLLALSGPDDETGRALRRRYRTIELGGLDDGAARTAIREASLDVLVDLGGHTGDARLALCGEKLAPVQLSYVGYPGTTGLSSFDGRISDALADPPAFDHQGVEPVLRLPRVAWAWRPTLPLPDSAPREGRPFTFSCFNRLSKYSPTILDAWLEILQRAPQAQLVLKAGPYADPRLREREHARFVQGGVGDRVQLLPWARDFAASLDAYRGVDVALDTYPYAGTMTTCDALLMGVPVVGLVGAWPASRVAASLLAAVGRDADVCRSRAAYVERAVELAAEGPRRARESASLRAAFLEGPLGDPAGLARALEDVYLSR